MATIGTTLRDLRLAHGCSQTDVCRKAGLPNTRLCKIEQGGKQPQYAEVRAVLAAVKGIVAEREKTRLEARRAVEAWLAANAEEEGE